MWMSFRYLSFMPKKKRSKKQAVEQVREPWQRTPWHSDVHPEIKKIVLAILFFVGAAVLVLSFVGASGTAGGIIYRIGNLLLGKGYVAAPLMFVLVGSSLLMSHQKKVFGSALVGGLTFLFGALALLHITIGSGGGGYMGMVIGGPLMYLFDFWVSLLVVLAMLAISVLLMLNMPFWRRAADEEEEEEESEEEEPETILKPAFEKKPQPGEAMQAETTPAAIALAAKDEASMEVRKFVRKFDYKKPPLDLLNGDKGKPSSGDIKGNMNIIQRTLDNFGIIVEMGEVSVGPTVTQYTLRPAEGIKLTRITGLNNDLSLALAAHPIRIEAPIPGKSLVGIEVPNRSIQTVGLRALLENSAFQENPQPLLFALGKDVSGAPAYADLGRMPHLLVSGATGTGKSIAMHALMASFLYRNPPEMLRFIIVDPKRVELSVYNDIPHLLTPVITDAKGTVQSLRWAAKEMDRRYDALSLKKCRDITGYNSLMANEKRQEKEGDHETDIMPHIVILIDELADIMMTFPREVESSVVRLAQMARAVGIHLIVATQRPSVDVITGLIKANIPSRIALQVASQIDSRTILDMPGAEKLLGNGDMLFLAGDRAKPRRIQGAFVSEQEIKQVVDFLREQGEPVFDEAILHMTMDESGRGGGNGGGDDDPLYSEAKAMVLESGKASASFLQRRLSVGYARAARLLDIMESRGVVGPANGAKPREIYATTADLAADEYLEN